MRRASDEEDQRATYKRIMGQTISSPEITVEQMVKRFYSTLINGIEVMLKEGYINPEDSVKALLARARELEVDPPK